MDTFIFIIKICNRIEYFKHLEIAYLISLFSEQDIVYLLPLKFVVLSCPIKCSNPKTFTPQSARAYKK